MKSFLIKLAAGVTTSGFAMSAMAASCCVAGAACCAGMLPCCW